MATLYHWDLPQALQDGGGWAVRATAEHFAEYAAHVGEALGDLIEHWITVNEPWVVSILGYARRDQGTRACATGRRRCARPTTSLLAHGLALAALRGAATARASGSRSNLRADPPATGSEDDRAAALRMDGHLNRWFLDPVLRGAYPEDLRAHYERLFGPLDVVRRGDLRAISQPIDFLGVNYYQPERVAADPRRPPLGVEAAPPPARRRRRWAGRSTPTACTSC